jgi:acyl carrier protein
LSRTLKKYLKQQLPDYMVPSAVVVLAEFPLTANGKLDRRALPALGELHGENEYVAPRTQAEQAVAQIWAQVLKLERVGAKDNFFECGGHSLLAAQVLSKVRGVFERELPLRALFEAPTVEELARRIEHAPREAEGAPVPPLVRVSHEGQLPLSFSQQRLWFLQQLEPASTFYNIPTGLRLKGWLDVEALRRALQTIVQRHEALRTRFVSVEGMPVQSIAAELELEVPLTDLSSLA